MSAHSRCTDANYFGTPSQTDSEWFVWNCLPARARFDETSEPRARRQTIPNLMGRNYGQNWPKRLVLGLSLLEEQQENNDDEIKL